MDNEELIVLIARTCHEANRALCVAHNDHSQPAWEDAPDWQKDSAMQGVRLHLFQDVTPAQSHEAWLAAKEKDGWTYGAVKNAVHKTHPCMRPYDELPTDQQAKDHVFRAIVHAQREHPEIRARRDMADYSSERTGFTDPE